MATVRGNGCRCVQTHCFPFGNVLYIDLSYPGKWAVNVLSKEYNYNMVCAHGRPQEFFQGGQTFGGAPKKSVKEGPHIFLDKL